MSEIAARLGRRVRGLRAAKGLTQGQLADAVEVTQATLSRVERGQVGVSLEVLERLAIALGVSVARLLDFDGEFSARDPVAALMEELPADATELRKRMEASLAALLADGTS